MSPVNNPSNFIIVLRNFFYIIFNFVDTSKDFTKLLSHPVYWGLPSGGSREVIPY